MREGARTTAPELKKIDEDGEKEEELEQRCRHRKRDHTNWFP